MKIAPHALVGLAAACQIYGHTTEQLRNGVPVTKDGRVRILDVLALYAGNPYLIGRAGNDGYERGDSELWDLNAPGTRRYVSENDISDDDTDAEAEAEEQQLQDRAAFRLDQQR
jgi:hypothetical protein